MAIGEFSLIDIYFRPLSRPVAEVALGMGDDAALLRPGSFSGAMAVSTDTLVEGVHFAASTPAADVGHKALAVNLSDLAAMGARPVAALLALSLPTLDEAWVTGFCEGFGALARSHGVSLIGGDTTRGPLSMTVTVIGDVPEPEAMRRSGAQAGDLVCVTGTLGDAALALRLGPAAAESLRQRLHRPSPRVEAGRLLRRWAHAAIDLSDGLLADLGHMSKASGVGATVRADLLPASADFIAVNADDALTLQAAGGDDYELCVCLPPETVPQAVAALASLGLALTVVGRVTTGIGVKLCRADGEVLDLVHQGYSHFPG